MVKPFTLELPSRESPVIAYVRHILLGIAVAYAMLAGWGLYRRIWQVQRVELSVASPTLSAGSTVAYDVITSGEVQNLIRLELVQGEHRAVLVERRGRLSASNTIDPRLFRVTDTAVISADVLSRFSRGPAMVRLTAFGGQKLLRTPAPGITEAFVTLVR